MDPEVANSLGFSHIMEEKLTWALAVETSFLLDGRLSLKQVLERGWA